MKHKIVRLFFTIALTLLVAASALAADVPAGKRVVVDQLGRSVVIPQKVERVV